MKYQYRQPFLILSSVTMKQHYRSDYKRIMSLIYEDQKIVPQANREIVFIPERIKAIRSMGRGVAAYRQPRETIFLHQAKMMEDYEDDYRYDRDIPAYQPTYESLTNEQLRGYFGWRTRLRKGDLEKAPQAFAFIYLYELINLIGISRAEEGFFRLSDFADRYGKLDPSVIPYAEQWLIDYVLYYDLNPILLADRKPVIFDRFLDILLHIESLVIQKGPLPHLFWEQFCSPGNHVTASKAGTFSDEDVFRAVRFLSGVRFKQLPAYLNSPELFTRVAAQTFADMCDYYNTHRKQTLLEDYVGYMINKPVRFFTGAVFHDKGGSFLEHALKETVKEVRLSSLTVYHFEYGKWAVKTYPRDFQNRHFAELLKTIDSVIREEEGDPSAALSGHQTKWIRKLIRKTIANCRREMEEEKKRRVEIDLTALDGIRGKAKETMEKLITEDDLDLIPEFVETEEPEQSVELPITEEPVLQEMMCEDEIVEEKELPLSLDEEEYLVIKKLIQNSSITSEDLNGKILSVIVDSINEKLFDEFGDIVIEDGNPPMLIEDYREELTQIIG